MSLILDALNRAEHERKNQNAVPDLSTLHAPRELPRAAPVGNKSLWIIIAAIVGLLLVATIIWWINRSSTQKIPPASVTPVVASASVPAERVQAEQVEPVDHRPVQSITVPPAEIAPAPQQPAVTASVSELYAEPQVAPAIDAGVSELYAVESSAGSTTIVDPFAVENVGNPTVAESETPQRTFASITNIPDFNELPWNLRQTIPTITYQRHNFLANGVSSVVINNQTAGVGNIIGVGQFVIQEIYVDGVVLKQGNTVFKMRALNGWINM